jgi:predicted dehydrogenase
MKIAIFGCGFWSQFQIGGWLELPDVEIVALYNRTLTRAKERAEQFGIRFYYDNAEELLNKHLDIEVIDIITDVDTHAEFVALGVKYNKNIICQKPMSTNLETARKMVKICREANLKYYVHENYRWQPQFRRIKEILDSGILGNAFRCKSGFNTAFPLFETQPFLAQLEQFALTDQGSHQFDVLRFLFGEVASLYCITQQVNQTIKGEDVATTMLKMKNGITCVQEISFSSRLEKEVFPQTLMLIECEKGSLRLDPDLVIRITTSEGTKTETVFCQRYWWQTDRLTNEPPSIVNCNENILNDLLGKGVAETTSDDNLKTVELVFAAYESASANKVIIFD